MMAKELEKSKIAAAEGEASAPSEEIESKELDEAGLKELVGQAEMQIASEEQSVLNNAEKQIVPPPSVGIEQAKANAVFESGGFATRIQTIRDRIAALATTTKEKISTLMSSQPEVIHFNTIANEMAQAESKKETETVSEKPKVELVEPVKSVEPAKVEAEETAEQKEKRELKEYLEKEVFTKFGLTKEAEEKMIAETPEGRREVLARSFENTRNSLQAFYDIQTIEGSYDANAWNKAEQKMLYDTLAPIVESRLSEIQPKLAELGIDISLLSLGLTPEAADQSDLYSAIREVGNKMKGRIKDLVQKKLERALTEAGEYQGITMPTEDQEKDKQFMDQRSQLINRILYEEEKAMIDEVGFNTWEGNLENEIDELFLMRDGGANNIPKPNPEQFKVKKTREEVTELLENENDLAERTHFLCVNITANKLETVLTQGGFKDIFALSSEELADMKRAEAGRGDNFYLNQRKTIEEALGVYDPNNSTVYGTYASQNRVDEKRGGADMYGAIFLKLKPTTEAVYCEGDSMSGTNAIASKKLSSLGIDTLDWVNNSQNRQIAPEHASIVKAMNNSYMKTENSLGRAVSNMGYIEAHIKGLNLGDIEAINIPRSVAESYLSRVDKGDYRTLINRLQEDPQWKDKINII